MLLPPQAIIFMNSAKSKAALKQKYRREAETYRTIFILSLAASYTVLINSFLLKFAFVAGFFWDLFYSQETHRMVATKIHLFWYQKYNRYYGSFETLAKNKTLENWKLYLRVFSSK
jgi:hypothetical protein